MKTYHLPATESDLQLLDELLGIIKRLPFEFAYHDCKEKAEALEKKWLVPTRESLFPPAIAERAEEMMQGLKPSDFKNKPMGSVLQKSEAETVARNIMVILWRTGDKWRLLSFGEYKEERLKDGNYDPAEAFYFDQVFDYCKSPETAKFFSPVWKKVSVAEEKISEQWYLCDEDLRMRESGVLSFRKGQKYLRDGFDSSDASICLINELERSHWVDNDLDSGAWLKHFTLITNDLRFEIEKGIQPAEVEFNQKCKSLNL